MGVGYIAGWAVGALLAACRVPGYSYSRRPVEAAPRAPERPRTMLPARTMGGRLRVRAEGDWNDQYYKNALGYEEPLVLETRTKAGKLIGYQACHTEDEAYRHVGKLKKGTIWRLIRQPGELVDWDLRV